MRKVKNTIPVVDICALRSMDHAHGEIVAEPFATYVEAHPNLHRPHRHSFYHLVLFTKGGGSHSIDFEQFPVAPGQIYFMKPGQVHSWSFEGETDGYVINFSEGLFHHFLADAAYLEQFRFFQGVAVDCVVFPNPAAYKTAKETIERIVDEVQGQEPMSADLVRCCLINLFITVSRSVPGSSGGSRPQTQVLLHNFRKLLDTHFSEKRLPKDYASMLYITPNHLNALCKDLLGRSAGEVIRDRILLEAKRLLVNADISIAEIAATLDFTDNSHFTRFFKKYTAVTPEAFRKNITGGSK